MPLPTPKKGETKNKFVSRCMSNKTMKKDFPETDQRLAVCHTQWRAQTVNQRVLINAFEADTSLIRNETYDGKDYTVIPLIALVEGVHQAANADGPELILEKEFSSPPQQWDGIAVTVGHPMVNGTFVPATSPKMMEEFTIGIIFNSTVESKKLKMEAWIDDAKVEELGGKAENIVNAIKEGEEIDVSTGYFTDSLPFSGVFNGEAYEAIQENIKPNHLAILDINQRGACSWEDGCGMARVNQHLEKDEKEVTNFKGLLKFFGKLLSFEGHSEESDEARRFAIKAALTEKDEMFFSVIAVYQDHFVYERGWNELLRRSFSIGEDGSITLGEEVEKVRPVTNFLPVVVNTSVDTLKERVNMNKKEKIDALIANEATQFVEEDRETLDGMDEAVLDKLTPIEVEASEEEETSSTGEGKEKETEEEKEKTPTVQMAKWDTPEQFISNAVPQELQGVLNEGLQMRRTKKDGLIKGLMANSQNSFSEDELQKMEVDQLAKLSSLARIPDYSGQGGNFQVQEGDGPPVPQDIWDLDALKNGAKSD